MSNDAETLRNAMKGFGTDEATLIKVVANRTGRQRQIIKDQYKQAFGRDLISDLKSELHGKMEDAFIALFTNPVEYDADSLRNAMHGAGTNEDTLIEIIASRNNAQLAAIKQCYQAKYNRNLEDDVKKEVHGTLEHLLVSLLQGKRSNNPNPDQARCSAIAKEIFDAGEAKLGTDESVFNKYFVSLSPYELACVAQFYHKISGHTILDAIDKEKDPAIVVDNFMKMEGVLMDNTEIKKGILGERSVGKTYYMPIAEQFDYRGDPFIRNVIMTVTAVSSVVGMYNAYKTHKEIGQAEDRLREVDARNQAGAQNVRDTAQHQVDQSESIAKGMEAQGYTDTGGLAGLGERRGFDRTAHDGGGWDFSRYDDTDIHEWYNSVMERTTRTLAENQRRFNAGEMTSVQYLRANEDVLRELAETRHQFIADYMPQLQEYARNNNYDLDAFLTSFDYELAHPGAIGEGLDSISTVMDDAESLLNYTVENAAGKLPDDFLTTMLGLGSAQVLFGKLAKDQETMIKRGYGNETIDAMKERRRKELGEMEPENEEENEEENEHSHRRR